MYLEYKRTVNKPAGSRISNFSSLRTAENQVYYRNRIQKEGEPMDCMKCGRQTQDKNVFCKNCLADMEKYPVKSDTPVVLPQRKATERKAPQKKMVKPEEIIDQLQLKIKRLWICIAVLLLLFTATAGALAVTLYQHLTEPEMGSNYSTYASTEATTASSN